jgi:hypothetical protein
MPTPGKLKIECGVDGVEEVYRSRFEHDTARR